MLEKVKTHEVPKRNRKGVSRFELTREWPELQVVMDKGIKPGESYQVKLSPVEMKSYGINNRRTIAKFLRGYIRTYEMPYKIRAFQKDDLEYVVVDGPKHKAPSKKAKA